MAIEIGFAVGALVLLAAIVYGVMQSSRRNKANDPVREAAVKAQYDDPDATRPRRKSSSRARCVRPDS